uniref:Uncharacterized protein n=1 Tax=Rhipicephalus microplus TaxID=6941 RepID=A0A6G5A3G0_RHIMP
MVKTKQVVSTKAVLFPSLLTVTFVTLYTKVVGIVVEVQRCLSHSLCIQTHESLCVGFCCAKKLYLLCKAVYKLWSQCRHCLLFVCLFEVSVGTA